MKHEEIRNVAKEYGKRIYGDYYCTRDAREIIIEGFIEGAKWVLEQQRKDRESTEVELINLKEGE